MKTTPFLERYRAEATHTSKPSRPSSLGLISQKPRRGSTRKPLALWAGIVLGCLAGGDMAHAKDPIPFEKIGEEVMKQYEGNGIGIEPTKDGAILKAALQDLEGQATAEGLWISSRTEEDAGKDTRFLVRATGFGRDERQALPATGEVRSGADVVEWVRPGVVEEYRVNGDGVRQDFVVAERPEGSGELAVELELQGAKAEEASYGAKLTLDGNNRELAYHRLQVTDASGRALPARMEVADAGRMLLRVDDANATYPVRIDPTFSDADWVSWNTGIPGADDTVYAVTTDSSNNLYAGGSFQAVGSVKASRVAKWSGSSWSALGKGVQGPVYALALLDETVYAGGNFPGTADDPNAKFLAKFNGTVWSFVSKSTDAFKGVNNVVRALAVNEAAGYVYVGGDFTRAGVDTDNKVQIATCVALWDSRTQVWSPLDDTETRGEGVSNDVYALAYDKTRNVLYAGGDFGYAGWTGFTTNSTEVRNVARWVNGQRWFPLDEPNNANFYGTNDIVRALAVTTTGTVYVGGDFTRVSIFSNANFLPADYIAEWSLANGWSDLNFGVDAPVYALALTATDKLWVGGNFTRAGNPAQPANYIVQWDPSMGGGQWNPVISDNVNGVRSDVMALAVDQSTAVYAGGFFRVAGSKMADRIAKMTGALTSATWTNFGKGIDDWVNAMVMDSKGSLYIGGRFITNGSVFVNCVSKWDGSDWVALGSGLSLNNDYAEVNAMAFDKSENNLYVAGDFDLAGTTPTNRVARWNLSSKGWFAVGDGFADGEVYSLVLDWQDTLIAGGNFTQSGPVALYGVARLVGQAWQPVANGPTNRAVPSSVVYTLAVDRTNAILYAGGRFEQNIGGIPGFIAQYSNSDQNWRPLGDGVDNTVRSLLVDTHASLNHLYVGGDFTRVGATTGANRIARWNRVRWDRVGQAGGFNKLVRALAIDSHRSLFAGGNFTTADGSQANFIAATDLSKDANPANLTWSPVGSGVDQDIRVLLPTGNNTLQVGGSFFTAGNKTSPYVAALNVLPQPEITSVASASGTVGQPFTFPVTASNNPTSFGAQGLPAGLSINNTSGVISGTPTQNGISSVTLRATNAGGTGTSSLTITITGKATPTISVAPTATAITVGQNLTSSNLIGGNASVGGTFAFTTPGTVPAVGTSSQSVTFTPTDGANFNTVTTSVSVTVNKVTPTIVASPSATAISSGQSLASSSLSGGNASVAGSFAFTTPGTVPAVGTSSQSVTFTPTDGTNFNTVTTNVNVTVNKATPTIMAPPSASAIASGQSLASSSLSGGSASVAGTFAFTTPGTVPAVGTSSQSVTFTPTDGTNFNTVTTSVNVTVNAPPPPPPAPAPAPQASASPEASKPSNTVSKGKKGKKSSKGKKVKKGKSAGKMR